jgi:hypothetical protein
VQRTLFSILFVFAAIFASCTHGQQNPSQSTLEAHVVLPKLFRRAVVYFPDRKKGVDGTLADWFAA